MLLFPIPKERESPLNPSLPSPDARKRHISSTLSTLQHLTRARARTYTHTHLRPRVPPEVVVFRDVTSQPWRREKRRDQSLLSAMTSSAEYGERQKREFIAPLVLVFVCCAKLKRLLRSYYLAEVLWEDCFFLFSFSFFVFITSFFPFPVLWKQCIFFESLSLI